MFLFNRSSTFRILEAYYASFRINALLEAGRLLEGTSNRGGRLLIKITKRGRLFEGAFIGSITVVNFYTDFCKRIKNLCDVTYSVVSK